MFFRKPIDITWFGGEPLLKTDLIERITNQLKANHKDFQAEIITNGSLLTDDILAKFPIGIFNGFKFL